MRDGNTVNEYKIVRSSPANILTWDMSLVFMSNPIAIKQDQGLHL